MLRVRPHVHTSDLHGGAGFLQALGLAPTLKPVPHASSAVFDAGSGCVALHFCPPGSADEGRTSLAFDVGDVREFARRTEASGTAVELSEDGHGLAVRITAPDGESLLANAGPRETGAPASPLSVLAIWSTDDVGPAVTILEAIGARPRTGSGADPRHDFRAKNGGLVAVRAGESTTVELAFEYDGDVRDLSDSLTAGGFDSMVVDESHGRSLRVHAPWGTAVRIDERRRDFSGTRCANGAEPGWASA